MEIVIKMTNLREEKKVLTWYFLILSMCSYNSTLSLFTDSVFDDLLISPLVLSTNSDILGVGGVLFSGICSEFPSWEDMDRTWLPTPELDSVLKRYSPFFFRLDVSGVAGGFFLGGGYLGAVFVTATKVSGTSTAISRCLGTWGTGVIVVVLLLLLWWLLLLLVTTDWIFGSFMASFLADSSTRAGGGDVGDVTMVFLISQTRNGRQEYIKNNQMVHGSVSSTVPALGYKSGRKDWFML